MEEQAPKEIKELFEGVAAVKATHAEVMADGKLDLSDLPAITKLAAKVDVLIAAVSGLEKIPGEVKDMTEAQAKAIVSEIYALKAKAS